MAHKDKSLLQVYKLNNTSPIMNTDKTELHWGQEIQKEDLPFNPPPICFSVLPLTANEDF